MTEEFSPDDEIVSSYLDGEATPEEVLRVESDPRLQARADRLDAARSLVRTPVPGLSPSDIDSLIDSSVGAAAPASNAEPVDNNVISLMSRRRVVPRALLAAAAIVAVALAIPALRIVRDLDSSSSSTNESAVAAAPATTFDEMSESADAMSRMEPLSTSAADAAPAASPDEGATLDSDLNGPTEQLELPTTTTASSAPHPYQLPKSRPPGFDPLPDELSPATDLLVLADEIQSLYSAAGHARKSGEATSDQNYSSPDEAVCANELAALTLPVTDSSSFVIDFAFVEVSGAPHLVALDETVVGEAIVTVVDLATCSTVYSFSVHP